MFRIDLIVRPRDVVRDPQSDAVQEALEGIGCSGLKVQSVGRFLQLELDASSEDEARSQVEDMCKRLLVNPNLETFDIAVEKLS
jgi:phosphoribosylformylglycinamidine synthase